MAFEEDDTTTSCRSRNSSTYTFPFQRIKPNPSTENLGEPSGAPTFEEAPIERIPQDDLVDIFKRMLDVGTPEFEHDVASYIHEGYSDLDKHYERIQELGVQELGIGIQQQCDIEDCPCHVIGPDGKIRYNISPERQWLEDEYFGEQTRQQEYFRIIQQRIDTLRVTMKEDIDILLDPNPKPDQDFDYKCYNPKCDFATNNRAEYEHHGVTKHPRKPCYPGKADLALYGWRTQGKRWEI